MDAGIRKVGLLVPENNTTMARELAQWLPHGSTCDRIGIPRGKGMLTPADLPDYITHGVRLARTFARGDIDAIVYGCTAAGFLAGPARDAQIASQIGDATRKPVVTTAHAMVEALRALNARRIAVVTPYLEAVNERLTAYLADSGIAVQVLASFHARTVDELGAITADDVARFARETIRKDCDALFIGCSQLPTREICEPLERELGKPVWSSIRATAWAVLRDTREAVTP